MKKLTFALAILPFFIATPALALTQSQVNAIIQFLVAFNADASVISSVQSDLQLTVSSSTPATVSTSTPQTIASPKIIVTPTTVYVPVQSPDLQPVPTQTFSQPITQQSFGSVQVSPTCSLTATSTVEGDANYRYILGTISWVSENSDKAVLHSGYGCAIDGGVQQYDCLVAPYEISPVASGTLTDLQKQPVKIVFTGNNQSTECSVNIPFPSNW